MVKQGCTSLICIVVPASDGKRHHLGMDSAHGRSGPPGRQLANEFDHTTRAEPQLQPEGDVWSR